MRNSHLEVDGALTPSTRFTPSMDACAGLAAVPAAAKRRTRSLRRHPLLETAVADGDRAGDFEAFAAALLADLTPVGATQAMLAARIVGLSWRLNRAQALESAFLSKPDDYGAEETPIDNCLDKPSDRQALESLLRWEGGLQRALLAALSAFRDLQRPPLGADEAKGEPLAPRPALQTTHRDA